MAGLQFCLGWCVVCCALASSAAEPAPIALTIQGVDRPSIAAGGRAVVFEAACRDDDGSGIGSTQVFLAREGEEPALLSRGPDGDPGNGPSSYPVISADGRWVAYQTMASNIVPGVAGVHTDVVLHDVERGLSMLVSRGFDGASDGESRLADLSDDGSILVFASFASNLDPGDTNGVSDVFLFDREDGLLRRVSVGSDGSELRGASDRPSVSGDGTVVAFETLARIDPADTDDLMDVYVIGLRDGSSAWASRPLGGATPMGGSVGADLTRDGRMVVFSSGSNITDSAPLQRLHIYTRDLATGRAERHSVGTDGAAFDRDTHSPSISGDGRVVVFEAPSLSFRESVAKGEQMWEVVWARAGTGGVRSLCEAPGGDVANSQSGNARVSPCGGFVCFATKASNLVEGDDNSRSDIVVRRVDAASGVAGAARSTTANLGAGVGG